MASSSNKKAISVCVMTCLALYPILYAYMNAFSFNYGEMLFIILLPFIFVKARTYRIISLPSSYFVFWLYAALILILGSGGFKVTYLIPGGIAFTFFSLLLGASIKYLDLSIFYCVMRYVFIGTSFVFVLQLLGLTPPDFTKCMILPISDHLAYSGTDYDGLINAREYSTRSSSIFLEPAYFAQYVCIFLIIELYYKAGDRQLYTNLSLLVILILLLSRSGCALVGLAAVVSVKFIFYLKYSKKSFGYIALTIPFFAIAIYYYFSSEMGSSMLERTAELDSEDASGYLRLIQGYLIYDYLPLYNKIFGITTADLSNMNIPFLSVGKNGEYIMFTNGISTLLIRTGIVGFILFANLFAYLYKSTNNMGKASLWLLLAFAFVEQVYLLFPMLLCFVLASVKKQNTQLAIR